METMVETPTRADSQKAKLETTKLEKRNFELDNKLEDLNNSIQFKIAKHPAAIYSLEDRDNDAATLKGIELKINGVKKELAKQSHIINEEHKSNHEGLCEMHGSRAVAARDEFDRTMGYAHECIAKALHALNQTYVPFDEFEKYERNYDASRRELGSGDVIDAPKFSRDETIRLIREQLNRMPQERMDFAELNEALGVSGEEDEEDV